MRRGQAHLRSAQNPNTTDFAKDVGVSKNRGTPKWMVYQGKSYETWMTTKGTPLTQETSMYPAVGWPLPFRILAGRHGVPAMRPLVFSANWGEKQWKRRSGSRVPLSCW